MEAHESTQLPRRNYLVPLCLYQQSSLDIRTCLPLRQPIFSTKHLVTLYLGLGIKTDLLLKDHFLLVKRLVLLAELQCSRKLLDNIQVPL